MVISIFSYADFNFMYLRLRKVWGGGGGSCTDSEVVVFSPACMHKAYLSLKLSLQKVFFFDMEILVYESFDVATSSVHPLNIPYILC